jgi:DNA-binding transcriptional MerR regulator
VRLAELSERTGVSVATLKYYLREDLLHPGTTVSRTQADYDESHVERVRLVRALSELGGLSLATVGRILEVITSPGQDWLTVLETAQRALIEGRKAPARADTGRASAWLEARGWEVDPDDPFIDDLDRAWEACDHAGIGLDEARMDRYADHVEGVAQIDVATVPAEPEAAIRQVIIGTILVDPVLAALRRLAQQHVSRGVDATRHDA